MSRILRRPMFRGGRVDSRGTGITSGLSYNNGGRVGFKDKGFVGGDLMANPGAAQGLDIFTQKYQPKDYRIKQQEWLDYTPKIKTLEDIQALYDKKLADERAYIDAMEIEQVFTPDQTSDLYENLYDLSTPGGKAEFFQTTRDEERQNIDDAKKYGVILDTELEKSLAKNQPENKKTADQLRIEELEKFILDQAKPKKLTEDEKLAEIEKKKKMFEKVYGSGKGEDINNMLLGFAGKALKPGADTKSAFSEFFEEEAKRPSESKKYKDAAAQAAIQSFLTGETSFQKFEDEMGMYAKKLGLKTKADRDLLEGMTIGEHKATISGAGKSDSQLTKAAAERYIASQPKDKGKILNSFSSKKDPLETLEIEENVNEYFMDGDTKHVYKIIKVDGEITSKRLY